MTDTPECNALESDPLDSFDYRAWITLAKSLERRLRSSPSDPKENWLMAPVLKWLDTQTGDEARICKDVLLDLWRRQSSGICPSQSEAVQPEWRPIKAAPFKNEPLIVLTAQGNICEADNYAGLWNMPLAYQDDTPIAWMPRPPSPSATEGQDG